MPGPEAQFSLGVLPHGEDGAGLLVLDWGAAGGFRLGSANRARLKRRENPSASAPAAVKAYRGW